MNEDIYQGPKWVDHSFHESQIKIQQEPPATNYITNRKTQHLNIDFVLSQKKTKKLKVGCLNERLCIVVVTYNEFMAPHTNPVIDWLIDSGLDSLK